MASIAIFYREIVFSSSWALPLKFLCLSHQRGLHKLSQHSAKLFYSNWLQNFTHSGHMAGNVLNKGTPPCAATRLAFECRSSTRLCKGHFIRQCLTSVERIWRVSCERWKFPWYSQILRLINLSDLVFGHRSPEVDRTKGTVQHPSQVQHSRPGIDELSSAFITSK